MLIPMNRSCYVMHQVHPALRAHTSALYVINYEIKEYNKCAHSTSTKQLFRKQDYIRQFVFYPMIMAYHIIVICGELKRYASSSNRLFPFFTFLLLLCMMDQLSSNKLNIQLITLIIFAYRKLLTTVCIITKGLVNKMMLRRNECMSD